MNFLERLRKPFFVLAPMDDVTDTVFRQMVAGCAPADLYFTEFVNVDGLSSAGRDRLMPKLKFGPAEKPIIAQIWGKTPDNYEKVAKQLVKMGFDGTDINMGCPDKSILKNGCCAALINNQPLAKEIIDAVKIGSKGRVPVSVKTRIGFNEIDLNWVEFLLGQDLDMLTVHLRTKKEMSAVTAHWELAGQIRELRDKLSPRTLIVCNGDVANRQHGQELAERYGLDGVMIGRGVLKDPFAFSKNPSHWQEYSPAQKMELYARHIKLFAETWQNNERKVVTLNKFCKLYINDFEGAGEFRQELMQAQTTDELLKLLTKLAKRRITDGDVSRKPTPTYS